MIKKYLFLFFCFLLFISCDDKSLNDTYVQYDEDEYACSSYLSNRSEDFSSWIEILKYADLYNAFNNGGETFTLFVPDNDAVSDFYQKMGVSSIEELGEDYAKSLVKYHSINDEVTETEFLEEEGLLSTSTLSGNYLTVYYNDDDDVCLKGYKDAARVTELANETSNGLIYVLDSVLTPLNETIYSQLEENDNYSIFKQAVKLTGWGDSLSVVTDTTYSDNGSATYTDRNYTVLVVPDDVFEQDGITDIDELVSLLGASSDYTTEDNALRKYVGYHIVSQSYTADELFPFDDTDSTIIWSTETENEVFSTSSIDGNFYINYDEDAGEGISLEESDIQATNGYIHEVDNYMPVWTPNAVTVTWDVCDYDDVASVVNAYGEENDLGDCYQVAQSSEYKITFSEDDVSSYTWKAYSSSSTDDWPELGYLLTKENSDGSGNTYGAYKNDMLIVNVGYMGYVTMKTPAIIKGKYKVDLYYACASSLSDFISGGSKCKITIDDDAVEKYIYDGATASVGIYSLTLFSDIEFDTTKKHTFKLTVMDSRASTHSSYRLQIDYVKFTPVTE